MNSLKNYSVAVLATDGFEESELMSPVRALREEGAEVHIISPGKNEKDKIQGYQHFEKTKQVQVDKNINDADPRDYHAVLLPGGAMNADHLRMEKNAQEFVKAMAGESKPIAVICHGAWLLVSSGLVSGKRMTSYKTIQDDLKNAGAEWVDEEVVVDSDIISSRQPTDLPAFNREMIKIFRSKLGRINERKSA